LVSVEWREGDAERGTKVGHREEEKFRELSGDSNSYSEAVRYHNSVMVVI
jgi:hypothetical protein